jgi:hypothetical protein
MKLLLLLSTVVAVLLLIGTHTAGAQSTPTEEFVGPFPSWRQVQCGGVDDTAMLQTEFTTLGRTGSPVLYLKPGTCRITRTLRLGQGAGGIGPGVDKITILGRDPADTKILWAGGSGAMLEINGVARSRFGRLTWDGGGTADMGWIDRTNNLENYFPTGNRLEDMVFQRIKGVGLYLGAASTGTSEWEYMRVKFIGPMQAGVFLGNQNTLDHWFWDSQFSNLLWGVTNYVPERNALSGGGDYAVNRSNFLSNGYDLAEGNVQVFASSRWNYSRGSKMHINWPGVGRVNSSITVQGLTAIDFTAVSPISEADNGPLAVIDSTFRGGKPYGMIGVHEAYCETNCLGDLWAIGNTFSNTSPSQYAIPYPQCCGRIHSNVDDRVGQTIVDPGPLVLPSTPPTTTRPIYEVVGGNIAAALAAAGNQPAVVHIPHGRYDVLSTLNVGPNIILTGDGVGATTLAAGPNANPILRLAGPSHATVRDLSLLGWRGNGRITTGLLADNADQPGGLVHAEFTMLQADKRAWDLQNLTQTTVDLFDDYNGANTHCGSDGTGPDVDYHVDASTLRIFNGAGAGSDAKIRMLNNATVVGQTVYFEGNPGCNRTNLVTPNSSGSLTLNEGNFAPNSGNIDLRTFVGQITVSNFANTLSGGSRDMLTRNFGPNSLVLGLAWGGTNDHAVLPTCESPCLLWLPQSVAPNNATPEQNKGVTNPNQFMKDHLAPLRAARPLPLGGRPATVTEITLIRVNVEQMASGIKLTGSPIQPQTPTSTPTATSSPTPTITPMPTETPIPAVVCWRLDENGDIWYDADGNPEQVECPVPTPTPEPTIEPTATPTLEPTPTPTDTPTPTATPTITSTPTATATPTALPYRVQWDGHGTPATVVRGKLTNVSVTFTNTGTAVWPLAGTNPVKVASWWKKDGIVTSYGNRQLLGLNVSPGGKVTNYQLSVVTPSQPGTYVLHVQLVREPGQFFAPALEFTVTIT